MRAAQPTVACLGEPLALVAPERLDLVPAPGEAGLSGAEANVAVGLAGSGVPVGYVGRVGADAAGRDVVTALEQAGVDVSALGVDPQRPTGRFTKVVTPDASGEPSTVADYRRAGSAFSAAGPELLADPAVRNLLAGARLVHCSGITPALSPQCAALMDALVGERRGVAGQVSFDVNWREKLWPSGDPAEVVRLAGLADLVLVGADEAERVLGESDPARLRALLPEPELLVIKDADRRAVAIGRDGTQTEVPALRVEVVEAVGAGDSFAAGFLHGWLAGEPLRTCLRRGHIGAAATLTVHGDFARARDDVVRRLLGADREQWAGIRFTGADVLEPVG